MAVQFLCDKILIDGSIVLIYLALEQFQLDAGGILAAENAHIVLKELEQVPLLIKFEGRNRFALQMYQLYQQNK